MGRRARFRVQGLRKRAKIGMCYEERAVSAGASDVGKGGDSENDYSAPEARAPRGGCCEAPIKRAMESERRDG